MNKNGEAEKKQDYRVEKDSIGTKDVPQNVYYGVQSLRAKRELSYHRAEYAS